VLPAMIIDHQSRAGCGIVTGSNDPHLLDESGEHVIRIGGEGRSWLPNVRREPVIPGSAGLEPVLGHGTGLPLMMNAEQGQVIARMQGASARINRQ